MAQRITVSVNEDLHARLQSVKSQINVSAVFQNALERRIVVEELRAQHAATGAMQTTIERLRCERDEVNAKYEQQGHKDGLADAENLNYEALLAIADGEGNFWDVHSDSALKWYDAFDSSAQQYSDDAYFDRGRYGKGWIAGVRQWWADNKEQIEG